MTADRLAMTAVGAGAVSAAAGISTFALVGELPGALLGLTASGILGAGSALLLARLHDCDSGREISSPAELLGSLSHEIRTPLNGILGMSRLLLRLRPTAEQREYLEMLKSSGEALLRLINDLLDYSWLEAGKLHLESETFRLRRFVRDSVKPLSPQAHLKGLELGYWVEPDVPELVRGDSGRLRQVLANLVVNAIKYTEKGEILVEVRAVPSTPERPRIRFSVMDTGCGVRDENREAIFEAFTQSDAGSRAQGGLGLGLAISSRIIERMGGELSLESEEGRGSTFFFEAPIDVVEGESVPEEAPEDFGGGRVLVVDASPMQRRILSAQLREWGLEVEAAADAASALASVERSLSSGNAFSLLLLDSLLGSADGWSLAKRIQERCRIPGILMTLAHEVVGLETLREHGLLGHLSKPVAPSHLSRAIEILRRGATVDRPEDVQSQSMDRLLLAGLRVLLAEDHPVSRTAALRSLENAGSEVVAAEDGVIALELSAKEDFDLLLLDLEMPRMNGLEVVRAIRERERRAGGAKSLPIVAITAHANHEERERCLAAGMDAFLSKPFDETALLDVLRTVMVRRRGGRSETPVAPERTKRIFDRDRALARASGDAALVSELCELLLVEAPRSLGSIATALSQEDWGAAERMAHRLKGALLTLAAERSAEVARELEVAASAGDREASRAALHRLEVELEALERRLSEEATEHSGTVLNN